MFKGNNKDTRTLNIFVTLKILKNVFLMFPLLTLNR